MQRIPVGIVPLIPNTPLIPKHPTPTSHNTILVYRQPPPQDWLKINTDATIKGYPGPTGAGIICRNHMRQIIQAIAAPIGITTTIHAETCGLLLAARLATMAKSMV